MALVPLGLLLAVVVTAGMGTAIVRRSSPSRETAVAAARRHATQTAVAAILLGSLAAGYVGATELGNGSPGGLGVTALLMPITFGIVHTVVLAAGELTWPRPQGEVRRARLVHRGHGPSPTCAEPFRRACAEPSGSHSARPVGTLCGAARRGIVSIT